MAIRTLKKIELIAMHKDAPAIIDFLQRREVLHIEKASAMKDSSDHALTDISTQSQLSQIEKSLASVTEALDVLSNYTGYKKPFMQGFRGRKALSSTDFSKRVAQMESSLQKMYQVLSLASKIDAARQRAAHLRDQLTALSLWEDLDIPMAYDGTEHTACFIGSLPVFWTAAQLDAEIVSALKARHVPDTPFDAHIVYANREQTCVVLFCHRLDREHVLGAIRDLDFVFPSDPTKHPPRHRLKRLRRELVETDELIETTHHVLSECTAYADDLFFLSDFLVIRKDKYAALQHVLFSSHTFYLTGFIDASKAKQLCDDITLSFTVAIQAEDLSSDADVPILFYNHPLVAPVENITSGYSLPSPTDPDPNIGVALFYYFFFGMMLSDAGYGLLIVLATLFVLFKFRPEGTARDTIRMFLLCGCSTFFWGVLFGSWFGNVVYMVSTTFFGRSLTLDPLWFDPVEDPLRLLIISFILGFVHILFGLGVKFYNLCRKGRVLAAFFDVGFWYLLFFGIVVILLANVLELSKTAADVGIGMALSGALGLVFTQGRHAKNPVAKFFVGLASLYDITGYFSDILSYSRLMALALVTGIIGTVVNTIGAIGGKSVLGVVIFVLIFIFGHAINLGINMLGAYVHGNRLQYVEFFSKFYEGGGRAFNPLGIKTRHYKFKEEK